MADIQNNRVTIPLSLYLSMSDCYFGNGPRYKERGARSDAPLPSTHRTPLPEPTIQPKSPNVSARSASDAMLPAGAQLAANFGGFTPRGTLAPKEALKENPTHGPATPVQAGRPSQVQGAPQPPPR